MFQINQHTRDTKLIHSLVNFFECGSITIGSKTPIVHYVVTKFSDITTKIIPFFNKYPIQGIKSLDYLNFGKAAEIIKSNNHLASSGLEQIKEIKSLMNRGKKL